MSEVVTCSKNAVAMRKVTKRVGIELQSCVARARCISAPKLSSRTARRAEPGPNPQRRHAPRVGSRLSRCALGRDDSLESADAKMETTTWSGYSEFASHIHARRERIPLDEFAPRVDQVAHQLSEDVVGFLAFLHLHLQQRARVGVERGLPELAGVHLAEALVALQRKALAAGRHHRVEQADRAVDRRLLVLAAQRAGPRVDFLQRGRELVELAGVGRAEQGLVDDRDLLDAAHGALEMEAVLEVPLPAAFGLIGLR